MSEAHKDLPRRISVTMYTDPNKPGWQAVHVSGLQLSFLEDILGSSTPGMHKPRIEAQGREVSCRHFGAINLQEELSSGRPLSTTARRRQLFEELAHKGGIVYHVLPTVYNTRKEIDREKKALIATYRALGNVEILSKR